MRITGFENNILVMKELGERIQDLRISEAMTQEDLADRSGLSLKTVARIEKGENTGIFNLLNVLRALGVLSNIEVLLPEKRVAPNELREMGKKRQRVSARQKLNDRIPFKWGDEK